MPSRTERTKFLKQKTEYNFYSGQKKKKTTTGEQRRDYHECII